MSTIEERLTAVEDTNRHTKELTEKVAQLVIAHDADIEVMKADLEVTKRQAHQFQRMLVLVARKMKWLSDDDLKEFESDD